jgi:predicted nicotinamide N-methyase
VSVVSPEAIARVRDNTVIAHPWLCPELSMHLITWECPLWYRTEEDVHAMGWETPYWAFAWPGGQSLARYLLDNPALVAGKTAVDFGAGGAIEGLAAMRAGAKRVIATDIDAIAHAAMHLNALHSNVEIEIRIEDIVGRRDSQWDVVLAGDMFYDAELSARVMPWLVELSNAGVLVLLGDPYRGNVSEQHVEVVGMYNASFDTDVRGEHLRRTQVARVRRTE